MDLPDLPHPAYAERRTGMGPHDVYYIGVAFTKEQMIEYAKLAVEKSVAVAELIEALELMISTHDEGGWPEASIVISRAALSRVRGN